MTLRDKQKRSRRRSVAGMMAQGFIKRLNAGIMIDRTKVHSDGKSRKKIVAPKGLLARPLPLKRVRDLLTRSQPAPRIPNPVGAGRP
jgi:hypothetical protein